MRYLDLNSFQRKSLKQLNTTLSEAYKEISKALNMEYPEAIQKTNSEKLLYSQIIKHSKVEVLRSVWIGTYNYDLFFPYCSCQFHKSFLNGQGNDCFKGLIVEVDGGVHYQERKMKIDNSKYLLLHGLNIGSLSIHNEDIYKKKSTVKEALLEVLKLNNLDFRAKQRLMRDIYLTTVFKNKALAIENNLQNCIKLFNRVEQKW